MFSLAPRGVANLPGRGNGAGNRARCPLLPGKSQQRDARASVFKRNGVGNGNDNGNGNGNGYGKPKTVPARAPISQPTLVMTSTWFSRFVGKVSYDYYLWRKDTVSDLKLFAIAFFIVIITGSFVKSLIVYGKPPVDGLDFWGEMYDVLVLSFGQDFPPKEETSIPEQIFSVFVAYSGVLSFAMVLALVEQVVLEVIESNVRRGSRVYESGHTLVLGWCCSQRDLELMWKILEQLCFAHQNELGHTVVVLTQRSKLEMEALFRRVIPETDRFGMEVVFRVGNPLVPSDLEFVAADLAAVTIIVSDQSRSPEEADAQSTRCAILLDEMSQSSGRRGYVVVEMKTCNAVSLVKYACSTRVLPMQTSMYAARRLVKMIKQPFIARVSQLLLDFKGSSCFYVHPCPQAVGRTFADLPFYFPDSIIVGVLQFTTGRDGDSGSDRSFDEVLPSASRNLSEHVSLSDLFVNRQALLNPPGNYRIQPTDELVLVRPTKLLSPNDLLSPAPVRVVVNASWLAELEEKRRKKQAPADAAAAAHDVTHPLQQSPGTASAADNGTTGPHRSTSSAHSGTTGTHSGRAPSANNGALQPQQTTSAYLSAPQLGTRTRTRPRRNYGTTRHQKQNQNQNHHQNQNHNHHQNQDQSQNHHPSQNQDHQPQNQSQSQSQSQNHEPQNPDQNHHQSTQPQESHQHQDSPSASATASSSAPQQTHRQYDSPLPSRSTSTLASSSAPRGEKQGNGLPYKPSCRAAWSKAVLKRRAARKRGLRHKMMQKQAAALASSDPIFDDAATSSWDSSEEVIAARSYLSALDTSMAVAMKMVPMEYFFQDNEPEKVLVCGWGEQALMCTLMREADRGQVALPPGSELVFVNTHEYASSLYKAMKVVNPVNVGMRHIQADPMHSSDMANLRIEKYKCAIVLCDERWVDPDMNDTNGVDALQQQDMLRLDSMVMMVQLNVRKLNEESHLPAINIICQKVAMEGLTRFECRSRLPLGISMSLTSYAAKNLAQVAYNPGYAFVGDRLYLSTDIATIDSSVLCRSGERVSFWELMARAQKLDMVLMGYYFLPSSLDAPVQSVINPMGSLERSRLKVWDTGDFSHKFVVVENRADTVPSEEDSLPRSEKAPWVTLSMRDSNGSSLSDALNKIGTYDDEYDKISPLDSIDGEEIQVMRECDAFM